METQLISIIIPTYNRNQLIGKTLDSVLAQTYEHWECLVIDDGSEDDTLDVLKHYQTNESRIQLFSRDRLPKGAPTCRNIGLEKANGDYIIFLDSDDYLLPFCLEQRIKKIIKNSNCDFLVFPMGEKQNEGVIKKEIPAIDDYLIPFLSANLPWQTMCPIWQKSFLNQLKGFTEGYPRFNDPELMIRALLREDVKFKVFDDLGYDTVHLLSPKVNMEFKDNVFKSLFLFIPDVVKHLDKKDMQHYKKYLAFYLHLWFKYFYIPLGKSEIKQSFLLIRMFQRQSVISILKSISLILRLLLYTISNFVSKRPINKLSDKALYA